MPWNLLRPARSAGTVCLLLAAGAARAQEPSLVELERAFRELPPEARRLTGPLFWLHGDESPEQLEACLEKVAEGGNGCFTAESRPHVDWLGEGWYRDLEVCRDAARAHDLQMWIFDEKWWPSGEVGRRVPERYASKRLAAEAIDVQGPTRVTAGGFGDPRLVAALAGRVTPDGIDGGSLVDLRAAITDDTLAWDAPAGDWKVMRLTWSPVQVGGRYLVDGASADAVEWYLDTVYQPHFDRFPEDFGTTIQGFFYDEPETHGDWGSEVPAVLAERGVDLHRALVAWKFRLAGEEDVAHRYQYQDALAEAWGRTLYGGITAWCHAHGVRSIGHFLEHRGEYLHPDLCAGNLFPLQKYSDMGGIDAVFSQFAWGRREAYDAPCWQTPKLGSSISHAYGKPDDVAMVEIFGARGQDLTYPEMKWWADHMHVSGVSFLIPHSFNPRAPYDVDCPPYFFDGGHEPRWPLYRVFADYTSRLALMLSGGRHVCPVALLFLGGSAHVGRHVLPDGLSEALQDARYDCDWLPYEVFERDSVVRGPELRLRAEAYRVLVVPPVEVIPPATLAKAREFLEAGGVVVGYGFLPGRSATPGRTAADVAALCDAIWGPAEPGLAVCRTSPAGGRSYLLPEAPTAAEIERVLGDDAGVRPVLDVVEGETDGWLHVLHRVRSGRDVFFVTNQDIAHGPRPFRLRVQAAGVPECWDPMRNEITAVPWSRHGSAAEVTLTLEPNESVLLVFQEGERALPRRIGPDGPAPAATLEVVRDPTPAPLGPDPLAAGASPLSRCSWVWYPEGDPRVAAPPGSCLFRGRVDLPPGRVIQEATFHGTVDNGFTLFVNGAEAGGSDAAGESWRRPTALDVTALLRSGSNQLALAAVNGGDGPNPAGALGCLVVHLDDGATRIVRLDESWKTARAAPPGWQARQFDDSSWRAARVVGEYGAAPWGRVAEPRVTVGPTPADPFVGHVDLEPGPDPAAEVLHLELEGLGPELAARVTVNGQDAGGFLGAPLRLDVTAFLTAGRNTVTIEPFAPDAVHLRRQPREAGRRP